MQRVEDGLQVGAGGKRASGDTGQPNGRNGPKPSCASGYGIAGVIAKPHVADLVEGEQVAFARDVREVGTVVSVAIDTTLRNERIQAGRRCVAPDLVISAH